jgi:ABC-type sugar transport system ATPase subunit
MAVGILKKRFGALNLSMEDGEFVGLGPSGCRKPAPLRRSFAGLNVRAISRTGRRTLRLSRQAGVP